MHRPISVGARPAECLNPTPFAHHNIRSNPAWSMARKSAFGVAFAFGATVNSSGAPVDTILVPANTPDTNASAAATDGRHPMLRSGCLPQAQGGFARMCRDLRVRVCVLALVVLFAARAHAGGRVLFSHDVNTFASNRAGASEARFGVNVADWLTFGRRGDVLLIQAGTGGEVNYSPVVIAALREAGYTVTISSSVSWTAQQLSDYDAVFVGIVTAPVASTIPALVMQEYSNAGGGIYYFGGVGGGSAEAALLNPFAGIFGVRFSNTYNGIFSVTITGSHPVFEGVATLRCGNGQSFSVVAPACGVSIIQSVAGSGIYAAVEGAPFVREHPVSALVCSSDVAMLTVEAIGTGPLSYQWQWKPEASMTWTNLSDGVNDLPGFGSVVVVGSTATQIGARTAVRNSSFRCVVSNLCGATVTNPANLTVVSCSSLAISSSMPGEVSPAVPVGGDDLPAINLLPSVIPWEIVAHRHSDLHVPDSFECTSAPDPLSHPYLSSTNFLAGADEVTLDNCSSAYYRFTFRLPCGFVAASLSGTVNADDAARAYLNGQPISPAVQASDLGVDRVEAGHAVLTWPTPDALALSDSALFRGGMNELVFAVTGSLSAFDPTGLEFVATVSYAGGCVADTDDGSGTGVCDGGVTIDDLIYYLFIFEVGDLRSDVDDGSGTGTADGGVTIDDLLYFLQRFERGC